MATITDLRAVVFDMDGTLVDSTAAVAAAYASAIAAAGGPSVSEAEVVAQYPLGPPPNILAHFLGVEATPAVVASYHEAFTQAVTELARVYDGIEQALVDLAAAGLPLAVFTGADTHSATLLLTAVGLARHFDLILGSDHVPVKPAPDGLRLVAEHLGIATTQLAYVGDSPLDQRCAHAAGALAVAAGWGHLHLATEPAELRPYAPAELVASLLAATATGAGVGTAASRALDDPSSAATT